MKNKSILMLTLAMLVSGCSLIPEYERPVLPVADLFPAEDARTSEGLRLVSWQQYFNDPRLNQLISAALENNRDLRIAILNVEASRLTYGISNANLYPEFGASGSNTYSSSLNSGSTTRNDYKASFGISNYELDLFGRVRSLSEASFNNYLATHEGRKAAQITLISSVAQLYVNERLATEQLAVAKSTLKSNQSSFNLIKQQVDAGIASDLDLKQAETQVLSGKVSVASFERLSLQAHNALVQIVGSNPSQLARGIALHKQNFGKEIIRTKGKSYTTDIIGAGLPSEVLLARPDIMGAERTLMAANANIGAARAAMFPRIGLTAALGWASPQLSSLMNNENGGWNAGPALSVPIFAWGKYKGNVDLSKVNKDISVANYEKTIQKAFKEVSDALVAKAPLASQVRSQNQLVNAEQERLNLAQLLYNNGIASYLDVLDAQRTLFVAKQNALNVKALELNNSISLFSALGGGYDGPLESEKALQDKSPILKATINYDKK
ncbi:outer membrane component of copper/silver efflux system [Gammaproteobacteria bacterium]|nr:outer membrane component of copper/silver efflux system [Gammaproteobacteria bacterium]